MNGSLTFKCPSCGAYLEFEPGGQTFACPYCGQRFSEEELRRLSAQAEQTREQPAPEPETDQGLRSYHCHSCGAEVVTQDTTAATRCYYCHNPVVLTDRLSGEFRPDGVLPFKLSREQAIQQFEDYIRRKRFVDRRFFSRDQMETFSGVYYPYWIGDIDGEASFDGEGTRVNVVSSSRETVTTTRYFRVRRQGHVQFRNMMRKALSTCDRQLSDGIHPFNTEEIQPFATGYLSGFLAERRDVDKTDVQKDMESEAGGYVPGMMKAQHSYQSLSGKTNFGVTRTQMRYVLMPAWILTYKSEKPGATYYYMMNGQTGRVCGKLPIDKNRLLLYAAGVGAAVTGMLGLGGAFLW